jgi:hypothetical protein
MVNFQLLIKPTGFSRWWFSSINPIREMDGQTIFDLNSWRPWRLAVQSLLIVFVPRASKNASRPLNITWRFEYLPQKAVAPQ